MPRITIDLTSQEAIVLEAAARYLQYGSSAEDMIRRAIRDAVTTYESERDRRTKMDEAEQELERVMMAYVRDSVKEYLGPHSCTV